MSNENVHVPPNEENCDDGILYPNEETFYSSMYNHIISVVSNAEGASDVLSDLRKLKAAIDFELAIRGPGDDIELAKELTKGMPGLEMDVEMTGGITAEARMTAFSDDDKSSDEEWYLNMYLSDASGPKQKKKKKDSSTVKNNNNPQSFPQTKMSLNECQKAYQEMCMKAVTSDDGAGLKEPPKAMEASNLYLSSSIAEMFLKKDRKHVMSRSKSKMKEKIDGYKWKERLDGYSPEFDFNLPSTLPPWQF